jgi:hypothetical protein
MIMTKPPNYVYFENQYGHIYPLYVLFIFKNQYGVHDSHLGLVVIISIIGFANRSACIQFRFVHNS